MFVKSCVDISLRDIEKDKITRSDTSPFFLENRLCAIIVPLFYRYPSTLFVRIIEDYDIYLTNIH